MSLSKESLTEAKSKLESLNKKDVERRRTAELKNDLEGYIYSTKEKVGTFMFAFNILFVKHGYRHVHC